ncbi:3-hydroxyisobutyryl-CoA hydrolase 1 [Bienertia sinuspersici]
MEEEVKGESRRLKGKITYSPGPRYLSLALFCPFPLQILVQGKQFTKTLILNRTKQLNALSEYMVKKEASFGGVRAKKGEKELGSCDWSLNNSLLPLKLRLVISRLLDLFLAYEEDPRVKLVLLKCRWRQCSGCWCYCDRGGDDGGVVAGGGVVAVVWYEGMLVEFESERLAKKAITPREVEIQWEAQGFCVGLGVGGWWKGRCLAAPFPLLRPYIGNGRAFCAGGDVAAVVRDITEGDWRLGANFFRKEFTLNYLMATYRKPQVSILNGIVMGGGAGASLHGRFRIVTESTWCGCWVDRGGRGLCCCGCYWVIVGCIVVVAGFGGRVVGGGWVGVGLGCGREWLGWVGGWVLEGGGWVGVGARFWRGVAGLGWGWVLEGGGWGEAGLGWGWVVGGGVAGLGWGLGSGGWGAGFGWGLGGGGGGWVGVGGGWWRGGWVVEGFLRIILLSKVDILQVFAMPETALGLFPDVGASYFLSRLPGFFGEYVGLTGKRLDGPEMLACGLATHYVCSSKLPLLEEELCEGNIDDPLNICKILDKYAEQPVLKENSAYRKTRREKDEDSGERKGTKRCVKVTLQLGEEILRLHIIDKCFSCRTVEEILSALEKERAETNDDWVSAAIESLKKASPTSLKISLKSVGSSSRSYIS